jgi:site-specific DNA-methyltransferase (adenine-specific)
MPVPVNTLTADDLKREWRTPDWLYRSLDRVFNFTLDAAATEENSKCRLWIDEEIDALGPVPWGEKYRCFDHKQVASPPLPRTLRVWLNPPHSRRDNVRDWIARCQKESAQNNHLIVALLPASTGTTWYHDFIHNVASVFLIRGRVRYDPPIGYKSIGGEKLSGPTFDSMIVIWWPGGMALGGVGSVEFVRE